MTTRVHRPQSAAELATLVRDASARGGALRIRSAGTWMDAGHPVPSGETVDLTHFSGIVAFTPDDLTIPVSATPTLAELDAPTRPHGQWCPLLSWGDDRGTVGATIATATAGPFAARLGRPRDLVLGVEAVDGLGRVLAAGGRVVKNVAGFDLTRAFTGSWGTLAVITQLHLRLRSRPAADESWVISASVAQWARLESALGGFARGPYEPLACLTLSREDATALALDPEARALVRIGGNAATVAAARAELTRLGKIAAIDPSIWDRVRVHLAPGDRARHWRWDTLSERLRERFDPSGVLNRGILGPVT